MKKIKENFCHILGRFLHDTFLNSESVKMKHINKLIIALNFNKQIIF